jgi:hypothetical protein
VDFLDLTRKIHFMDRAAAEMPPRPQAASRPRAPIAPGGGAAIAASARRG